MTSGGNLGGAGAPSPHLHRKLTNFRKFWSKRGLKTVFLSANGGMARNARHAPALYSGYLRGTWFN
jgi:hypothetical protein